MNSDTPSTLGENDSKQERLGWAPPSCLAASGKTLCLPAAVDFPYWLVTTGLGAGDVGMAGSEPADVDRLGLHWWMLHGESKALGHSHV